MFPVAAHSYAAVGALCVNLVPFTGRCAWNKSRNMALSDPIPNRISNPVSRGAGMPKWSYDDDHAASSSLCSSARRPVGRSQRVLTSEG
jgi:hypothetical protein